MKTQKTKGFYDRENDTVHIFIPPAPTESERGGITAKEKTTESLEVTIDSATGKAYVALDKTLSKTGEAADAAVVGEKLTSMGVAIENVKEDKADKTALAKTDRKLDALWKLNQGISYEFQTDEAEAYQKTVPSGAKMANVKSIGGKTIVWNQLNLNSEKSVTKNGISFINNEDGSWTINGTCSVSNDDGINTIIHLFAPKYVSGHKYLVKSDKYSDGNYGFAINGKSYPLKKAIIINYAFNPIIFVKDKVTVDNVTMRMNIFDLTQMFGSGNEPSTPEEFEAMFPADYYPYNAGELMSTPVNEVIYLDAKTQETSYPIPQAILDLPGYGWSAGDACNEADFENKQYIQRVGHYEFSENTAIRLMKNNYTDSYCSFFASTKNAKVNIAVNGIMSKNFASKYIGGTTKAEGVCCETANLIEYKVLFEKLGCAKDDNDDIVIAAIKKYMLEIGEEANYPLIEPIITDISDIIDSTFQEPLEVEAGGTLTFKNSNGDDYRIPVPSSEEYVISLAEVAK